MPSLPLDSSVQAEYTDGFILDETEQNDTTLYEHLIPKDDNGDNLEGNNTFADILNKRPEAEHGRMVRFSVFWKNTIYSVDWTKVPDNSRPIRVKEMYHSWFPDGSEETGVKNIVFGYQFTDDQGKNQKITQRL